MINNTAYIRFIFNYFSSLTISHLDFSQTCCKSTLMYVADSITGEKCYHLTGILSCNKDNKLTDRMKAEGKDGKESLLEFFQSKRFQLKWNELKEALLLLDIGQIVDHIEAKFLYSQGNDYFSRSQDGGS